MRHIRIPEDPGQWRADERTVYAHGLYRVPEDMPDDVADRALASGDAVLVEQAPAEQPAAPKSKRGA